MFFFKFNYQVFNASCETSVFPKRVSIITSYNDFQYFRNNTVTKVKPTEAIF